MSHVARSIFLACWWAACGLVAPVCVAATVSPFSTAQATALGPGATQWTIADAAGTWDALRSMTTTPTSATNSGALTVQTAAKVPTKHGAVDAVIKREIPYSKLVTPWKKAVGAIPLVGTGYVVLDILADACINPTGLGMFEKCYTGKVQIPAALRVATNLPVPDVPATNTTFYGSESAAKAAVKASLMCRDDPPVYEAEVVFELGERNLTITVPGCGSAVIYTRFYCDKVRKQILNGKIPTCEADTIAGYGPATQADVDGALDNYPSRQPDHARDKAAKLWKELADLPDTLPQDARSVDATGLSEPTISGPSQVQGPKTTEATSAGTQVKQESSTITYQGDKTTVTNNTTVTNINNAGDVVNETTTTEESQTDCEKNPSAVSCAELGDPPDLDIPKADREWQITPESLPGGACPGGFTFPIPGQPTFSWVPLCERLPAVRAVLLVLASVLAAWIVVGGLQS